MESNIDLGAYEYCAQELYFGMYLLFMQFLSLQWRLTLRLH